MASASRTAILVAAAAVGLAGCAETSFQDVFGAGKYAPDESQVATNQSLSMPPDLSLRAPADAGAVQQPAYQQAYQAPQAYQPVPGSQPPPAAYEAPEPQQPAYQAYQAPAAQQPAYQAPGAAAEGDVYARHGISRVDAHGKPKTQGQLTAELRQKRVEAEKAKNPNYGSIYNMGSVWSDN